MMSRPATGFPFAIPANRLAAAAAIRKTSKNPQVSTPRD